MDVSLKIPFLVFLLIAPAWQVLETDFITEADENTRYFILEQNGVMTKLLKEEMLKLFTTMSKSFDQKLTSLDSKLQRSMENLSEEFSQKLRTSKTKIENSLESLSTSFTQNFASSDSRIETSLNVLTDSLTQKQKSSDSTLEMSLEDLWSSLAQKLDNTDETIDSSLKGFSDSFAQKQNSSESAIQMSLQNISESNDLRVTISESTVLMELENLKATINRNMQRSPLLQETAFEEVSGDSGTIEFNEGQVSNLKRKIWIIPGNANVRNLSFFLKENQLGQNAHLTVWSVPEKKYVWTGSQIDWRNEVRLSGVNIVLITLSVTNNSAQSPNEYPSFTLAFNSKLARSNPSFVNSKEVRRSEGLQFVSHPLHNNRNYPRNSFFYSLIAPSSGNQFNLTLKYLDVPGTPPQCGKKWFAVYVLRETKTGCNYESLQSANFKRCGDLGHISEFLGNSEVALVYFWSATEDVGKGFRMEIQPSEKQTSTLFSV